MPRYPRLLAVALAVVTAAAVVLLSQPPTQGAAPAAEAGWVDLFPGKDLAGWKRVPIAPDTKLSDRNPWQPDPEGRVLHCAGKGIKEMLLHETERGDGVFHVTWRFHKSADRTDYNSGVYVRTSLDGKVWHQAQVAHVDRAPHLGDLFGETKRDGRIAHFVIEGRGEKLAHPPGEWNAYEVTCKGPTITVAVNGARATTWKDCRVPRGHVGLQAEFFDIDFKDLRYRPLD